MGCEFELIFFNQLELTYVSNGPSLVQVNPDVSENSQNEFWLAQKQDPKTFLQHENCICKSQNLPQNGPKKLCSGLLETLNDHSLCQ